MSFSLTVPRCESIDGFEDAVYRAKESPKSDGRTKIGKRQAVFVEAGKEALAALAYGFDGPYSGTVSGHINPDLTGNVNVTLNLLANVAE